MRATVSLAPYARSVPQRARRSGRGDVDDEAVGCIIGRMAFASPAAYAPRGSVFAAPATAPEVDPVELRDELTRARLLAAVEHLPGLTVEEYDREWWDGQAHVASLVVRGGRRMRRMRVIETSGTCLIVPFSRRLAHRWLAARRRPRRPELGGDRRRTANPYLVLDAWTDALRCSTRGCAAVLPVAYSGGCPLCGG
jgi:hypothetical protein